MEIWIFLRDVASNLVMRSVAAVSHLSATELVLAAVELVFSIGAPGLLRRLERRQPVEPMREIDYDEAA